MKAQDYPPDVQELIKSLALMPGTGRRSAERLALWFLQRAGSDARHIADAITRAVSSTGTCPNCGFFAPRGELCTACGDPTRDAAQICVVERATDVLPIEHSGSFQGLYHCLGGKISPLDGILPETLSIEPLVQRVREHPNCEVILAVGNDVEGEATALYLAERLRELPCRITRLAQGMPAGAGLSQADSITVMRALNGRTELTPAPIR